MTPLSRLAAILAKTARILARIEDAAARARAAHEARRAAEAEREGAENRARACAAAVRAAEARLAEAEAKAAHLYAQESEIRTTKAARAYAEESETLADVRARIEEEAYARLGDEDAARTEVRRTDEVAADLARRAVEADAAHAALAGSCAPILADLEKARAEAEAALPVLTRNAVAAMTRSGRWDIVAPVVGAACGACGSGVPPGKAQRVRAGSTDQRCESCGRFLAEAPQEEE